MLYLKNILQPQILLIPRDGNKDTGNLTLEVLSTIDKTLKSFDVIDNDFSDLYFNVSLSLPEDMPIGEHEYTLLNGPKVLSKGLLILTEDVTNTDYQNTIQYEQYFAD